MRRRPSALPALGLEPRLARRPCASALATTEHRFLSSASALGSCWRRTPSCLGPHLRHEGAPFIALRKFRRLARARRPAAASPRSSSSAIESPARRETLLEATSTLARTPHRLDRGDRPHVALHPQQRHHRGLPSQNEIDPAQSCTDSRSFSNYRLRVIAQCG